MKIRFIASAAIAALVLVACAGTPKAIPQELSARELVQRAQEATDAYNYDAAIAYYDALNERYGSDPLYMTTSEYEIAYIAYKEGNFSSAKQGLEDLLAKYAGPDGASLPQRYAVLAKKVLESIAERRPDKKQ